jgi:hypothetical protein
MQNTDLNFKLPTKEIVEYKGERYIIKRTYQESGDDLKEVLKKRLLKNIENIDNV